MANQVKRIINASYSTDAAAQAAITGKTGSRVYSQESDSWFFNDAGTIRNEKEYQAQIDSINTDIDNLEDSVTTLNTNISSLTNTVDTLETTIFNMPSGPQGAMGVSGNGLIPFGATTTYGNNYLPYPNPDEKPMDCLFSRWVSFYNSFTGQHVHALYLSNQITQDGIANLDLTYAMVSIGPTVDLGFEISNTGGLLGSATITGNAPGSYPIYASSDGDLVIGYIITDEVGVNSSELNSGNLDAVVTTVSGSSAADWSVEGSFLFGDTIGYNPNISKAGTKWEIEMNHYCNFPSTGITNFQYQLNLSTHTLLDYGDLTFTRASYLTYTGILTTKIVVESLGNFYDGTFSRHHFLVTTQVRGASVDEVKCSECSIPIYELNNGAIGLFSATLELGTLGGGAVSDAVVKLISTKGQKLEVSSGVN